MHYKVTIPLVLALYVDEEGRLLRTEKNVEYGVFQDAWGTSVTAEPIEPGSDPSDCQYFKMSLDSCAEEAIHNTLVDRIHVNTFGCVEPARGAAADDELIKNIMDVVRKTADGQVASWFET